MSHSTRLLLALTLLAPPALAQIDPAADAIEPAADAIEDAIPDATVDATVDATGNGTPGPAADATGNATPNPTADAIESATPKPTPDPIAPARWHIMIRGGMHIWPDDAARAIAPSQSRPNTEIAIDYTLTHRLALGLALSGGAVDGGLYGARADFAQTTLHPAALYRLPLTALLGTYARLGPTLTYSRLALGDGDDTAALHHQQWHIGARAALGLEAWLLSRHLTSAISSDFALGLALEAFYTLEFIDDWTDDGIDPGPFDPSGPGWLLGAAVRW